MLATNKRQRVELSFDTIPMAVVINNVWSWLTPGEYVQLAAVCKLWRDALLKDAAMRLAVVRYQKQIQWARRMCARHVVDTTVRCLLDDKECFKRDGTSITPHPQIPCWAQQTTFDKHRHRQRKPMMCCVCCQRPGHVPNVPYPSSYWHTFSTKEYVNAYLEHRECQQQQQGTSQEDYVCSNKICRILAFHAQRISKRHPVSTSWHCDMDNATGRTRMRVQQPDLGPDSDSVDMDHKVVIWFTDTSSDCRHVHPAVLDWNACEMYFSKPLLLAPDDDDDEDDTASDDTEPEPGEEEEEEKDNSMHLQVTVTWAQSIRQCCETTTTDCKMRYFLRGQGVFAKRQSVSLSNIVRTMGHMSHSALQDGIYEQLGDTDEVTFFHPDAEAYKLLTDVLPLWSHADSDDKTSYQLVPDERLAQLGAAAAIDDHMARFGQLTLDLDRYALPSHMTLARLGELLSVPGVLDVKIGTKEGL